MTDIVGRLRARGPRGFPGVLGASWSLGHDAADEIERLRAALQIASNLIADDLTDCAESDAPEHFAFLAKAAEALKTTEK